MTLTYDEKLAKGAEALKKHVYAYRGRTSYYEALARAVLTAIGEERDDEDEAIWRRFEARWSEAEHAKAVEAIRASEGLPRNVYPSFQERVWWRAAQEEIERLRVPAQPQGERRDEGPIVLVSTPECCIMGAPKCQCGGGMRTPRFLYCDGCGAMRCPECRGVVGPDGYCNPCADKASAPPPPQGEALTALERMAGSMSDHSAREMFRLQAEERKEALPLGHEFEACTSPEFDCAAYRAFRLMNAWGCHYWDGVAGHYLCGQPRERHLPSTKETP